MISKLANILKQKRTASGIKTLRAATLCTGLLLIISQCLPAQVINNYGAQVIVTSGIYVTSKDVENNSSGSLLNNGSINLSGYYLNNATTSGNGKYRIGGNWTNNSLFLPGISTVIFNGSDNQTIITGGNSFYNLSVMNSGAGSLKYIFLGSNVLVLDTLTLSLGIVDAGTYLLHLNSTLAASLHYTSTTGSRILGKFERGVGEQANYLFPLGTALYYNPANLKVNSLTSSGSILSQFFSSAPGNNGLPMPDPPVEIADAFPEGYWRLTPNSFNTSDFNINLDAAGFSPDTVRDVTRLIKRTLGGNWAIDGSHQDAVGTVVYRNNLTGDLDPAGSEFALGRERPLITAQPVNDTLCEGKTATFTVTATGATPFTYRWYKNGVLLTNTAHYNNNARTATLTILNITLADADNYYCEISDRYRNKTTSSTVKLIVMKIPAATLTNSTQPNKCSNLAFDNMVLGLSYYDPGSRFDWVRDNPSGISSLMAMSGTYYNIGDFLSGSFNNSTDAPVIVTFTILPFGPGPTRCPGAAVTATITVNPHPRATPINNLPAICFGASTDIVLNTHTTMTQGIIDYDYKITKTGASVTGNTASDFNRPENYHISYPYQNSSDTIQSVYYHIMPKNSASGCLPGDTVVVKVKVHPKPLQKMYLSTPFTCAGGANGVMTAILSKGSKPDLIHWGRPSYLGDLIYPTTSNTANLAINFAGQYYVTVRDSLNCFNSYLDDTTAYNVLGPFFQSILDIPPYSTGYGVTCPGASDGTAKIMEDVGSTGVAPYEYWLIRNYTDTLGHGTLINNGIISIVTGLPAGTYRLSMQDANTCKNGNPPEEEISEPPVISVAFANTNVTCKSYNDGYIKATVTGGNGNYNGGYTYKWTTSFGSFTGPDNLDHITNVTAGRYKLTVTDGMLCSMTDSTIITEPDGMTLIDSTLSHTPDHAYNISCAGGNTGSINITVNGGTLPYSYSWTGPSSYTATTEDISQRPAGTYVCTVTDAHGCMLKLPPLAILPTFTLTEPPPLSVTVVKSDYNGFNIKCNGDNSGSINVAVTGGSGSGYAYNWNTTNGSGIIPGSPNQTTLTAGTYTLIVTDLYGCIDTKVYVLNEPPKISTTLVPADITCAAPLFNNGSVNLTVDGGVSSYSYLWSPNGATTKDISGLTQGTYSVTVTDANGCPKNDNITINNPLPVLYTKTLSLHNGFNISCTGMSMPDGSIAITPTQGAAPYLYTWTLPDLSTRTTQNISGVGAGNYYLEVTDSKSCKATETITLIDPGKLSMMIDTSRSTAGSYSINCAGGKTGSIDITPVHAVGSVGYLWNDGSTSKTRTDIPAGIYKVIITDSNNCSADSTITLRAPDSLKLSFSISEPWCPDKPDGAIGTTVTGGVVGTDYTYKWSPDGSAESGLANILPGIYRLTVTDLNNCVISKSVDLKPQQESCLVIPNAISPNGDLINDVWNIGYIELYPNVEIMIFNRWGETLWRSARGYPDPWDGKSNGSNLPIDSYHYIIDLHNGRKPIVGNVTIVR